MGWQKLTHLLVSVSATTVFIVITIAFLANQSLALIWSKTKHGFLQLAVRLGLYQLWISVTAEWDSGKQLAETEKKIWNLKDKVKRAQHGRIRAKRTKAELEDHNARPHGPEVASGLLARRQQRVLPRTEQGQRRDLAVEKETLMTV